MVTDGTTGKLGTRDSEATSAWDWLRAQGEEEEGAKRLLGDVRRPLSPAVRFPK